ncbi:DUF2799 domain-containing protein [Rheinheimera baltica]|uniref:DUF2799 domain-containing protein n=1 Tax=Rheinheimera baltica TaxID=67576 RepID=UPI00273FCB1C|nr:DUF2799 domain-containing protein [Rheinheimera baltica]MDP5142401.1 DUF2799 domain-containing protein [Rheinheimera baltica]
MLKQAALLCITLAMLTACASMDKSECLTADWRTIGFEDGAKGKNETAISEYRQDCADHGVTPDLTAYRRGHREGAEQYCTHRNGFAVGRSGGSYQSSCPSALEADFLSGFRDGQQLYQLQRAVNAARSAFDKQQRLLTQLEQDIVVKTELLVEDGLTRDERIALLNEIEDAKHQLIETADYMPELEQNINRAEQALARGEKNFAKYQ